MGGKFKASSTFELPYRPIGNVLHTLDFIEDREVRWSNRPPALSHRIENSRNAHVSHIFHAFLWDGCESNSQCESKIKPVTETFNPHLK